MRWDHWKNSRNWWWLWLGSLIPWFLSDGAWFWLLGSGGQKSEKSLYCMSVLRDEMGMVNVNYRHADWTGQALFSACCKSQALTRHDLIWFDLMLLIMNVLISKVRREYSVADVLWHWINWCSLWHTDKNDEQLHLMAKTSEWFFELPDTPL